MTELRLNNSPTKKSQAKQTGRTSGEKNSNVSGVLDFTKLCGLLGSKGRWMDVAANCVSSGQRRKTAPTAMRILTLGRHSSSSPSYKPVMTSRKLPRDLRRILFKAPCEGPPTTLGQEIPPQACLPDSG